MWPDTIITEERCAGPASQEGCKWFAVDALDGAIIVNVGDILEVVTKN